MDHHAPYLRGFLGFLGLTDVQIVSAQGAVTQVLDTTPAAARARTR